MALKITIDDSELKDLQARIHRKIDNPQPLLKRFHVYMMGRTGQTFRQLRRGGSFRGVTWREYADQYTRKTDGVTVPAWGNVPRLRAGRSVRTRSGQEAMVRGRLRPSGKRITPSSNLLRDTGRLAAAAGTTRRWSRGGRTLNMITQNVAYGPKQQAMRPFLFFEIPRDLEVAARMAQEHLEK